MEEPSLPVTQAEVELQPVLRSEGSPAASNPSFSSKHFIAIISVLSALVIAVVIGIIVFVAFGQSQRATASTSTGATSGVPSVRDFTSGMSASAGLVGAYYNDASGRIYLQLTNEQLNHSVQPVEFILTSSISDGLGVRDLYIDRGIILRSAVVRFQRASLSRILLIERSYENSPATGSLAERRAVIESFPESILAAMSVVARDTAGVLVDATDFMLFDRTSDLAARLTSQGTYTIDAARTLVRRESIRAFTSSLDLEVTATLALQRPPAGAAITAASPDPASLSLSLHRSLVRLPPLDSAFRVRAFDPRCGGYAAARVDLGAPLSAGADWSVRALKRFRLQRAADGISARQPIIYYVDSGIAEPVLSRVCK
jgi:hypothetical protein